MKNKLLFISLTFLSQVAFAEETVTGRPVTTSSQLITWLLSTFFILGIILLFAFLLKKTKFVKTNKGVLTIENQLYISPKQRILLVKAGQKKILVGVCPNQINYLTDFDDSKDEFEKIMKEKQNTDDISKSS